MNLRVQKPLVIGLALLLGLTASIAVAAQRLVDVPEPTDTDVVARKAAPNSDESELDVPSAKELKEAQTAAALEAALVAQYSPDSAYASASASGVSAAAPAGIAAALDQDTTSLLERSGRLLVASETRIHGSTRYESATYSNGKGLVLLIWQDWPTNVDLQGVLSQGTRVERLGNLDITIREISDDNMFEVGVFDGVIYARAYTTFTEDLTLADAKLLALRLYKAVSAGG